MFHRPESAALLFEVKSIRDHRTGTPFGAQPRKASA
jgi:hypothetical protein